MSAPQIDSGVSSRPLDIAQLTADLDQLAGPEAGAVAHFVGRVRDLDNKLVSLTLEHAPGMTERALQQIAEQATARFDLTAALIRHRYGRMTTGQPIVFVGAASHHRHAALDAVNFMMDYLKTDAPFWKKEERADGSSWVSARQSDQQSRDRWSP